MPADPEDYPLLRSQTALLAQALRLVSRDGYTWWQVQTAPVEKVLPAVRKLDEKYAVLMPPKARVVRREARLPVAHLLLAPVSVMPPENPPPTWPMLLLADRRLPGEGMRRVADPQHPLYWVAWREGEWRPTYTLRKDRRGRWTWFLEEAFHRSLLEEALAYAAEGNWRALVGHMKTLGNLPMFSGVWAQLQEIRKRVQKLWGDRHLRDPSGQWKTPPWRKVVEEWPKAPLSPIGMHLYPDEPPGPSGSGGRRTGRGWGDEPARPGGPPLGRGRTDSHRGAGGLLARAALSRPLLPSPRTSSGGPSDWPLDPKPSGRRALTDAHRRRPSPRGGTGTGAPSAARDPEGEGYIASAEGPEGPVLVRARHSEREAYREGQEWTVGVGGSCR